MDKIIIPNNYYRISIKALVLDEEKRFMLFQEENGTWELPGGGLDFGETIDECLKRELREEASLEVVSINPRPSYFVTSLHTNGNWKSNVIYEVKLKDLKFRPSDECVGFKFFTKDEASQVKVYPIVKAFLNQFNPQNHL